MTQERQAVAVVDKRPFFEKALEYGLRQGIIDRVRCDAIIVDGAKGTVQVADYFGTSHLQTDIENARKRIIHLVSLYLEDHCNGDLAQAAQSLQANSFLFHSRSGNEMLKRLHAMPESTIAGDTSSLSLREFQNEKTLAKPFSLAGYRKERKRRQSAADVISAADWFCEQLQVVRGELDFTAVETLIRSAILMRLGDMARLPNHGEFARLIDGLRLRFANSKLRIPKPLLDDVPSAHSAVVEAVRRDIEKQDGALILNPIRPLDVVLNVLESRYFLRDTDVDDIDGFAGFVSEEWRLATKGKDDPYSRLTMFMCLATGAEPKTGINHYPQR